MSNLEETLKELSRYGRVWLNMGSDLQTWSANVEVSMSIIGAKFEVRSDYNHKTPLEAALQLRNRLLDALVTFDGKTLLK